MSRIGKSPVQVPQGAKVSLQGNTIAVEGPKGSLSFKPGAGVTIKQEGANVIVSLEGEDRQSKSNWGTARATINNMCSGVVKGWKRSLEMNGVGFGAKMAGQNLTLTVGFSHDVVMELPKSIRCTVTKNVIELESADRQLVGMYAAKIRKVQPPEPYLGKGIKYAEEKIRRKAGKTAKK
jgi:large subunit ribosomal protein L6